MFQQVGSIERHTTLDVPNNFILDRSSTYHSSMCSVFVITYDIFVVIKVKRDCERSKICFHPKLNPKIIVEVYQLCESAVCLSAI